MKRILSCILIACIALITSACWWTDNAFDNNYICGVNNYFIHHQEVENETVNTAEYYNNMEVDFPITVWLKMTKRVFDGQDPTIGVISIASLQYRILPDGNWVTVKTIKNPVWDPSYSNATAFFGRNNITPFGAKPGNYIMLRVWLSDGIYQNGDRSVKITNSIPNVSIGSGQTTIYQGGWSAPYVMVIKWSGRTRPIK